MKKKELTTPILEDGELILKAKFASVDPYMCGRMSDVKSYVAAFVEGILEKHLLRWNKYKS